MDLKELRDNEKKEAQLSSLVFVNLYDPCFFFFWLAQVLESIKQNSNALEQIMNILMEGYFQAKRAYKLLVWSVRYGAKEILSTECFQLSTVGRIIVRFDVRLPFSCFFIWFVLVQRLQPKWLLSILVLQ